MKNKKKICFIASSGGHLEQINQLKKIDKEFNCFYVTNKTESTKANKKIKYTIHDLYRGKSNIKKMLVILVMFFEQLFIYLLERPDIVITTGAGLVIPMCLIAKFFKKKVIYIESFARINSINKSGKFLYKYADLFIVQWQSLLKIYPNAIYWGCIY